jgi:hypothetical protein
MGFSVFLMSFTGMKNRLLLSFTHILLFLALNTVTVDVWVNRYLCPHISHLSISGQIRWLALNGTVGLALMWVFNRSGMDSRWVVFSTHSVGYVLLALVVVIMILVFGGVVLVWSHLIDFLKEILVRYPEVKEEISENKVLEQVLIR